MSARGPPSPVSGSESVNSSPRAASASSCRTSGPPSTGCVPPPRSGAVRPSAPGPPKAGGRFFPPQATRDRHAATTSRQGNTRRMRWDVFMKPPKDDEAVSGDSLRSPVRLFVLARARREHADVLAHAVADRDLPLGASAAREGQVASVRGPGRVLAASLALSDLSHLLVRQVQDG